MDPAAEIPQGADPILDSPGVDGKRLRTDPVAKVLGDDNLLIEIILRLGFPTTLVHAALVCKRWLGHASDPAILSRFRKLHPPHLLGFYVSNMLDLDKSSPQFVPMQPQPPELDAVIRRTNFSLDTYNNMVIYIVDCKNSNVFISLYDSRTSTCIQAVHSPLRPDRMATFIPQLPPRQPQHGSIFALSDLVWRMLTSIPITHLYFAPRVLRPLLVNNKIYMASLDNILVLDLLASSFSIIQFPQRVEHYGVGRSMLSRADDDTSIYLIHANELQLGIWLHKREKWSLVDTINLRDMLADLRMSDHTFEDGHTDVVLINQVGNNAEFVFLQIGRSVLYLDTKCGTLRKVYGIARQGIVHHIHPFSMIWPPTFPAIKEDPPSEAT